MGLGENQLVFGSFTLKDIHQCPFYLVEQRVHFGLAVGAQLTFVCSLGRSLTIGD